MGEKVVLNEDERKSCSEAMAIKLEMSTEIGTELAPKLAAEKFGLSSVMYEAREDFVSPNGGGRMALEPYVVIAGCHCRLLLQAVLLLFDWQKAMRSSSTSWFRGFQILSCLLSSCHHVSVNT